MSPELLNEAPLAPPSDLGPYRREDYDRLPDQPRCELVFGRLYVTPSPSDRHQTVSLILSHSLLQIAEEAGGRVYTAPIDVVLAEHSVVQPDLVYISAGRLDMVRGRILGAPDLVVEVLSRRTARRDRGEKLSLYARSGVVEYWLVEPDIQQIEFLVSEAGRFVVALPVAGVYRSLALPELHLDLAEFWGRAESLMLPRR